MKKRKTIIIVGVIILLLFSCSSKKEYNEALTIYNSDASDRHEKAIDILEDIPLYFYLKPNSSIQFKNRKWFNKARKLKEEIIEDYKLKERDYINNFYSDSKLVYIDNDSEELMISSIDGKEKKKVDFKGTFYKPLWSPDGRYIVFSGMYEEDYDTGIKDNIFLVDREGKNVIMVTHNEFKERSPAWSFDSKRITFVREKEFSRELIIYELDSKSEWLAFPQKGDEAKYEINVPVFLPESYDILAEFAAEFCLLKNNSTTLEEPLELLKATSKNELPEWMSKPGITISRLRFSPDYKELIFTSGNAFTRRENYIYTLNSKAVTKIAGNRRSNLSPDSRYIVFDILESKNELHISRRDITGKSSLPFIKLYEGHDADWSPWFE